MISALNAGHTVAWLVIIILAFILIASFAVNGIASALKHATQRVRALVTAYATLLIFSIALVLILWVTHVIQVPPVVGAVWSLALPALVVIIIQTIWPSVQVALFAPFDVGDTITMVIEGTQYSGLVIGRDLHGTRLLPAMQEKTSDGTSSVRVIPNAALASVVITRLVKDRDFSISEEKRRKLDG